MNKAEPPSPSGPTSALLLIGRDSEGRWVVRDRDCRRGGLFVGRADALKYAMFENGNNPRAVIMVPGVLELDMKSDTRTGQRAAANPAESLQSAIRSTTSRRAA